jgi:4-diphosphocytidyl-2-C-methyl-D-erythritol kinase
MRLLAPAKINLHLRVGPPRVDGFHPLLTWMCTCGLFDTLELERADLPGAALRCDDPRLPCDSRNLVVQAIEAFANELNVAHKGETPSIGLWAYLMKRIPVGAGLGGGSSDVARALLGLNSLWKANWSIDALAKLGARIGSDVPFFLHGPSSICTGRGEFVRPTAPPAPKIAILMLPRIQISTAVVYGTFDAMQLGLQQVVDEEPDWNQWATLPSMQLLERLVNDLEPPAMSLYPDLKRVRGELEKSLGRKVRMSGSGSALFTLFDELAPAEKSADAVRKNFNLRAEAVELAVGVFDDVSK